MNTDTKKNLTSYEVSKIKALTQTQTHTET